VVEESSPARVSKLLERSRIQPTLLNVTRGAYGILSADPPFLELQNGYWWYSMNIDNFPITRYAT